MHEIGTRTDLKYDVDTKEYRVRYSDSVDAFLRSNELARKKEAELGLKKDASYVFIGSVPMTVVMKIKAEHGIDLTNLRDKEERRKAFQIIQRDYPLLKGTNMRIG
jgi:hypothetical protein